MFRRALTRQPSPGTIKGMRIARDSIFDQEARRLGLAFCCEDCGQFDPVQERCRHEWPTEDHRRARYQVPAAQGDHRDASRFASDDRDASRFAIVFCKEFELC